MYGSKNGMECLVTQFPVHLIQLNAFLRFSISFFIIGRIKMHFSLS